MISFFAVLASSVSVPLFGGIYAAASAVILTLSAVVFSFAKASGKAMSIFFAVGFIYMSWLICSIYDIKSGVFCALCGLVGGFASGTGIKRCGNILFFLSLILLPCALFNRGTDIPRALPMMLPAMLFIGGSIGINAATKFVPLLLSCLIGCCIGCVPYICGGIYSEIFLYFASAISVMSVAACAFSAFTKKSRVIQKDIQS